MDTYDDIRPYRDDEVGPVLARLAGDPAFVAFASRFAVPGLPRWLRRCANPTVRLLVRRQGRRIHSVNDLQKLMAVYLAMLLRHTSDGMTTRGLDGLDPSCAYLFISNHRDITLDPMLLNYALWLEGHTTTQVAIGDNLLGTGFRSHLMRLNKAFLVYRDLSGAKAQLQAMRRTSAYMRNALEVGESVWIAQREGRSKDGIDRTEPALLKVLHLAYRSSARSLSEWLRMVRLVPVGITYEIDPCAPIKARELFYTAKDGHYNKEPEEDANSIESGIAGFKGRIHLHFSAPVEGEFDKAEDLARRIDRDIVSNLVAYPTHHYARARLAGTDAGLDGASDRARDAFLNDLATCASDHVPHFLRQYANQVENKLALGTGASR